MPAVLVEVGFINSDTDNQLFDDNFQDIAQAIADGILDTLESNGLIQEEKVPVYRVQVGLFRNQRYANRLLNRCWNRNIRHTLTGPVRITESMWVNLTT